MAEQTPQSEESTPKRKLPMKTMIVVASVLLIEGIAISGAFLLAGGPIEIKAEGGLEGIMDDAEKSVEAIVVAEKFPNARQGRVFVYDTEVYIVIKKKHQEEIEAQLKEMSAQISTEIRTIFARADPNHLLSADLSTLSRQIKSILDGKLGNDEEGKSRIDRVLIRKCTQYRL